LTPGAPTPGPWRSICACSMNPLTWHITAAEVAVHCQESAVIAGDHADQSTLIHVIWRSRVALAATPAASSATVSASRGGFRGSNLFIAIAASSSLSAALAGSPRCPADSIALAVTSQWLELASP